MSLLCCLVFYYKARAVLAPLYKRLQGENIRTFPSPVLGVGTCRVAVASRVWEQGTGLGLKGKNRHTEEGQILPLEPKFLPRGLRMF